MSLKKVLSLQKYCFLKPLSDSKVLFTPLSQRMKENIAIDWIKCVRRLPSIELFVSPLVPHLEPIDRNNSLKSILDNYNNYYRVWSEGSTQSIAVIQRFICSKDYSTKSFSDSNKNDFMVFALFCKKHESLYWYQKLQGIHNQWFRNLSKSPLKSKFLSGIKENEKKWVLNYKSEEFSDELETIEYFSESLTEKTFGLTDCDVISCNIDLDNSLIAFLCDAFTKKVYTNGKSVKKMKINSSLAPIKIAFTFRQNDIINELMINLAKHLILSLREFDISVLPFTASNSSSIESYDELGIPYVVILDKESTQNGVIYLRNRDSDTEESVHISRFQQTICLNLKLIHPSNIRNDY